MLYTQLRSFHAVAAEGGFTAASKVLHVGQPTITSQVKALEEQFRVELFHRHGRQVEMTSAGRDLFTVTRKMLSFEAEAIDLLKALGGLETGSLKIGAVGPYHVTEMLSAFGERFPGLKVQVNQGNSREMLRQLQGFAVDIAVLDNVEPDERLYTLPVGRHPISAFVNRDHRWFKRRGITLAELAGERLILREQGSTTRRLIEQAMAQAGLSAEPAMEIGSREAVWMAVEKGLGVGIVNAVEFVPHPRLKLLPITDATLTSEAQVVCLAERQASPLIRAFLSVIGARTQEL
ncbi:MAG: LysR substrate-binding domain-containing protein [Rhodovibrionaceae bacterium]